MEIIKCQAKHSKTGGCYKCGGFGHLLEKHACDKCEKPYWDHVRNGETVYEGKWVTAFDGTRLRFSLQGRATCQDCESSEDSPTCSLCGLEGHPTKDCKDQPR